MEALEQPFRWAFTGNPMVFNIRTPDLNPITVELEVWGNSNFYTVYPTLNPFNHDCEAKIDVSDLLKEYPSDTSYYFYYGIDGYFSGRTLNGGVSKQELRRLKALNTTPFQDRFLEGIKQFAFTTRTIGNTITIRRRELLPIYFLSSSNPITVSSDGLPDAIISYEPEEFTPFDIVSYIGSSGNKEVTFSRGPASFKVVILDDDPKQEYSLLLKFRNSLGVFEAVELTGKPTINYPFTNTEGKKFDGVVNDFTDTRNNSTYRVTIDVESGYKSPEELAFLIDLILSKEVYLFDKDGNETRVLITADSYSRPLVSTIPQSIKLKIKTLEDDPLFTPILMKDEEDYLNAVVLASRTGFLISTRSGQLIGV